MKASSVLAWALLLLAACATSSVPDPATPSERDGLVITREDIERSGALNGWEALRWCARHLTFQQTRDGSPVRVTQRGVESFVLDPQMLLVLDGTHLQSLSILETIPAANIEYIQVLSDRVGVVKYGTGGGNGVIVVRTGVPPPRDAP